MCMGCAHISRLGATPNALLKDMQYQGCNQSSHMQSMMLGPFSFLLPARLLPSIRYLIVTQQNILCHDL